jgi:hypothetical protein
LRLRGRDEAGLQQPVEFVARTDDKRPQR